MSKIMWVVGKYRGGKKLNVMWDMQGIYDSEQKALDECKGHDDYFIGPIELNKPLPDETLSWPRCYYPSAEKEINTLAHSVENGRKTIIVNGIEVLTHILFATYTDILQLTDPLLPFRADYTMTWSNKVDKGIMHHEGKPVTLVDGMIFSATLTGDA